MQRRQWYVLPLMMSLIFTPMNGEKVFAGGSVIDTIQQADQSGNSQQTTVTVSDTCPNEPAGISTGNQYSTMDCPEFKAAEKAYHDAYSRFQDAVLQGKGEAEVKASIDAYQKAYAKLLTAGRSVSTEASDAPVGADSSSGGQSPASPLDLAAAEKAYQDAYNRYLSIIGQGLGKAQEEAASDAYQKAYQDYLSVLRTPPKAPTAGGQAQTGADTGCQTNAGIGVGTQNDTGCQTGNQTGTPAVTGTDTGCGSGSGTGSAVDTGRETGTGFGSGQVTGTSTGLSVSTGSGTGTGSGTDGEVGPSGLRYGIEAVNGSSQWTQSQKDEANRILATLPDAFRCCTKQIIRESDNVHPGALGWSDQHGHVWLADSSCAGRSFQGPFVHELTHNFQGSNPAIMDAWKAQFWANGQPNPPSVSGYGNSMAIEDMAESVRSYWQVGPRMKSTNPERYEFIRKNIMGGVEFGYHVDN